MPISPPWRGCPAAQRDTCPILAQRRNTMAMPDSLRDLAQQLVRFAGDRDWQQFHSPKNLASALVVGAGELLECSTPWLFWALPTTCLASLTAFAEPAAPPSVGRVSSVKRGLGWARAGLAASAAARASATAAMRVVWWRVGMIGCP